MHKKSTSTLPFFPDDNKGGGKKWRLKEEEEPSPPSPKMHKKSTSTLPFFHNKGGGKKWRLKEEEEPSPPSPFDYPNVQRHKKPFSLGGNNGGGKTHKKSKQPSEKRMKSTLPFFLQPDNEDIHILSKNAPKCPGEFHSFYNEYRSDLVDKNKEHIKEVGGQMITMKDRDQYSHVGISSDSRNVVFKVHKESLYIEAKPKGGEEMQRHEFEMPNKRYIPGDELLSGPSMSMADCIDGQAARKNLDADAALLREWERLSKLQIYFYEHPTLVQKILHDVDMDGILRFIDENVSLLKTLTYDGKTEVAEVARFCIKFKDDMLKPGENLYKILVECR